MHLVMIITKYRPFTGGAEKQAERMARALLRKGHRVTVLTRHWKGLKTEETAYDVKIMRLPFWEWRTLAPITFMLSCLFYLWRQRREINLIHAHQYDSAFTASVAKIITGIPVIAHFHGGSQEIGSEVKMLSGQLKGRIILKVIKRYTDAFITVSSLIYGDLLAAGIAENVYILPNGVDVAYFTPPETNEEFFIRKQLGLPADKVIFLFSGRLEPVKGLDLLMDAWLKLDKEIADTSLLLILGGGSLYEKIKNQLDGLSNIIVKGEVENVRAYLRAADVFVLPSRYEGISLAILEAMACGLPVILTRVGGNTDIVEHLENGVLVSPEDVAGLTEWMELLYRQGKLRLSLSKKARVKVVKDFSFLKIMLKYESLCSVLVNDR